MHFAMLVPILVTLLIANCDGLSPCGVKCASTTPYVLKYYWRDYFGSLPNDAFPGGRDEEGGTTYIGQAYIRQYELLPGTIYPGCNKLRTSAYDLVLTPNTNIKILCTNAPEKLKWMPTKKGELHKLINCHLVVGGSEVGLNVCIGRTQYNGQTIVGKVFQDDASNSGLWIPEINSPFIEFEVLTYGCY